MEWRALYHEVIVFVLATRVLDHKPLLLHFTQDAYKRKEYYRGFKFEAKWQLDDKFGSIMEEAWHAGYTGASGLQTMQNKLAVCQKSFTRWSGAKYGNAEKLIKQKTKELEELQLNEGPEQWAKITRLKTEIEFIME
jgi:hypothetical protein